MNAVVPFTQSHSAAMNALLPRSISEAIQLSETLAKASLVPEHLRNKPGDCLLVTMQAQRWGMDALSVAQCTSVVRGKLCYEGKLVAAVLYSMGAIEGRLSYTFTGEGQGRTIAVSGKPRGGDKVESVTGNVGQWATDNGNWKKDPDSMLVYRGTRQWARRYAPEALLGVYTPEEIEAGEIVGEATVVTDRPTIAAPRSKSEAKGPPPASTPATEHEHDETPAKPQVDGEPGVHLAAGMLKVFRAKLDAAQIDEPAALQQFPRISQENINEVLAWLREQAEANAQG